MDKAADKLLRTAQQKINLLQILKMKVILQQGEILRLKADHEHILKEQMRVRLTRKEQVIR